MSDTPPPFFRPGSQPVQPPRPKAKKAVQPAPQAQPQQAPFDFPPGFNPGAHQPAIGPEDFNPAAFYPGETSGWGQNANPLSRYFRVPGMHVALPSRGAYLPQGAIEFTATGEIPVFPMRAADEIVLKNPDSLMSGYAIEQMLSSCVPAIKAPHMISMPDLDVLFLAIRAASFGEKMEFEVKCPECGEDNVFDAHLPSLLQNVTELPHECPVRLTDDVVAYMRPYNLRNATTVAMATFEETRRLQAVSGADEMTKSKAMSSSIKRITELSERMMADCVMAVVTPDGAEQEQSRIAEFLANIPRGWTKKIDDALKALNEYGLDKTIAPTCSKCGHTWETQLEFDPASFFGQGS